MGRTVGVVTSMTDTQRSARLGLVGTQDAIESTAEEAEGEEEVDG